MSDIFTIAIIGVGPRGLAALEAIYQAKQARGFTNKIKVLLFEKSPFPGAGTIWSPSQIQTNLSNVSERHLSEDLHGRNDLNFKEVFIPGFPSYKEWIVTNPTELKNAETDFFPPRAKLGVYLNTRFESIKTALLGQGLVELVSKEALKIETTASGCLISDDTKSYYADEVVLTVGHQTTYESDQLKLWEHHVEEHKHLTLVTDAYPVKTLLKDSISIENSIALRGFGLTMIDQVRALTLGLGAQFKSQSKSLKLEYIPSEDSIKKMLVYSLDGLPPVPKPVNPEIDSWFQPLESEIEDLKMALVLAQKNKDSITDADFLVNAIAHLTASVYLRIQDKARAHSLKLIEITELAANLIRKADTEHELILSHKLPALEIMKQLVAMSFGSAEISLDYCLGQCWRYALGIIYHDHTFLDLKDEAMVEVVKFIEASKRYSYGPPVVSIQELIALEEAGVLDIHFANDPKITLVKEGWQFEKDGKTKVPDVMVNSIIDAPQLVEVSSAIIQNLRANRKVDAVSYKLGLHTLDDGRIISKGGNVNQNISLLGRLAKGSVIGVDDLIECFGKPAHKWAEGVLKRLPKKEK